MKIHFISIGGSVMHQLAIALKKKGYEVSGSDDEIFEPASSNLRAEGLLPEAMGWIPSKLHTGLDAVILGMHAKKDNEELARAQELNLPIYSFPEYIFKESLDKKRVVIGGSHGKTTTTAMIMHVLKTVGKNFDFLVGARLEGFDQSVQVTSAPLIVCEGDEYPASAVERRPKFHFLHPHVAVLTGIAWDHINVFPTFENYLEQFRIFLGKIETGGTLIYNETDTVLKDLVAACHRSDITYLPYGIPEHTISEGQTTVSIGGAEATLEVFGAHNLLNMAAAYEVCNGLGVSAEEFVAAITSFKGASKRLEVLAKSSNAIVYRDFAHAPSKVTATINAVKAQYPDRRLIGVLELHTFSSLNEAFLKEFEGSMDAADDAVVFFSRHALELKRMPLLSAADVQKGFAKEGLEVLSDRNDLEKWLHARDFSHSVLLLMSSGNYDALDLQHLAASVTRQSA